MYSHKGPEFGETPIFKEKRRKNIKKKSKKIPEEMKKNVMPKRSVSESKSVSHVKYNSEIKVRTKM